MNKPYQETTWNYNVIFPIVLKPCNKPYQETTWNYNRDAAIVMDPSNKPYQETTWNYNRAVRGNSRHLRPRFLERLPSIHRRNQISRRIELQLFWLIQRFDAWVFAALYVGII